MATINRLSLRGHRTGETAAQMVGVAPSGEYFIF